MNRVSLIRLSAIAILLPISVACMRIYPARGTTSLDNPDEKFETLKAPSVNVKWGGEGDHQLSAVLVTNSPLPPSHDKGYNGLARLTYGKSSSIFVPAYAGLNFEHIINGKIYEPWQTAMFEPRQHPMELRKINDTTYELYQAALPESGVESCTRFEFKAPHYIDVTFECIPRKDFAPNGYLGFFWASYIDQPKANEIYFLGRAKGDEIEKWIKGVTTEHGKDSTHRAATDKRQFKRDEPFPLVLPFSESNFDHSRPFYYGRQDKNVWIMMFDRRDQIRFTQSPSGGGDGCPAWDFQWYIENPVVNQKYSMTYRAAFKPWVSQADVIEEFEKYRHGR